MLGIIITSVLLFCSVIIFLIFFARMVFGIINKNKDEIKKSVIIMLVMLMPIFLLSILDGYFVVTTVYKNRKKIVEFSVNALDEVIKGSSQILSKSLRYTADDLWNNWDNEFVAQLENIELEIKNYKFSTKGDVKTYAFEVEYNNKNESLSQISYSKIFSKNYLTAADTDDMLYSIINYADGYQYRSIPRGKTSAILQVNVPSDIKLSYLQFADKRIRLK